MIHTLRSLTQLVALPLCFAYLLLGCASPGPEFTAWYKEHASTTARPKPNAWARDIGGPQQWRTSDGTDAGTEGGGLQVFTQGFEYFRIRVGVLMRLTDKKYWVGCAAKEPFLSLIHI